jgi:hypothetical protein
MNRLSTFVFTLVVAVSAAACSSPTAPSETSLTLAPGQSGSAGALIVRFISVTSDTRCPANALCIQAGDASIALAAAALGTHRSFELQVLNPANRAMDVRGYTIEVEELSPYPFSLDPINPADYRVKLRVFRD